MAISEPYSDSKLASVTVGKREEHNDKVYLADYTSKWSERYREVEAIISKALGRNALLIEHVGSTSIPGLPAKPIVDIVLEVPDSDREMEYVNALEDVGFVLRIRESDWFKHRLLKLDDVNLHVFSENCKETARMLGFRDWLRSNPDELEIYLQKKRELASQTWKFVQNYADAKSEVIEEILARAMTSGINA